MESKGQLVFAAPYSFPMAVPTLKPDQQCQFAAEIVETLRSRGFDAYWAGGCVRDRLLGRVPKDYDVATNATPCRSATCSDAGAPER